MRHHMQYLGTSAPPTLMAHNMAKNTAIEQAIDDLISQGAPNVTATARKYNLVPSTLHRRYNGVTVSARHARSQGSQLLTDSQKEVIIGYLNKLSDRGFHPTPQILENLVVETVGHPIGTRWIERFCKRHCDQIKSIYLRNIYILARKTRSVIV